MDRKRKLLLLFSLDCFLGSLGFATLIFTAVSNFFPLWVLGWCIYWFWRDKKRNQLVPKEERKPTLADMVKYAIRGLGIVLIVVASSVLGNVENLNHSIPFLVLSWALFILISLHQLFTGLEKLAPSQTV